MVITDEIDLYLLKIAFPTARASDLIPWIEPLRAACNEFGIDTVRELASFLANISVESNDLRNTSESLNYSIQGLLNTFGRHRISSADCQRFGRAPGRPAQQREIANRLYGGEWGRKNLGNTQPNDGWDFRGGGIKQITGRRNYQRLADYLRMPLSQVRDYIVNNREGSCRAAGWFWKSHNLDAKAATPGVEDDRRAINGGLLGIAIVKKRFSALIKELLRRGC